MEIVLLILKIIGIVLLAVLGLLLLLILLVVFFPVSYRINASYQETLTAKVKVSWLFHFVSVTLDYGEKGKRCILRLLGIPLTDFLNPKPKKEKKKGKKKKRRAAKKRNAPKKQGEQKQDTQRQDAQRKPDTQPDPGMKKEAPQKEPTQKEAPPQQKNIAEWFAKLIRFPARLLEVLKSILQKCRDLWNKGVHIREKLAKWLEVLQRERTKIAVGKAKRQIVRLLKQILPRKWNAYVEFGFDDPAVTGQILGYYWMLIGVWGEHFICVPDFEHKVFSGNIEAKGRIQVFQLIYAAYQFMFDKDLVYLRKLGSEIDSE